MKPLRATLAQVEFADTPPGGGGRLALDPGLAQRLLEELIYERVSTQVDLLELTCFERELDDSIERVMAELDDASAGPGGDAPGHVLASALVDRAWRRVEDDWRELRADDGCPICAAMGDEHEPPPHVSRPRAPRS